MTRAPRPLVRTMAVLQILTREKGTRCGSRYHGSISIDHAIRPVVGDQGEVDIGVWVLDGPLNGNRQSLSNDPSRAESVADPLHVFRLNDRPMGAGLPDIDGHQKTGYVPPPVMGGV